MNNLLHLSGGVGRGQDNDEEDAFAADNALREIGAYRPPPEYATEPQRYTTEPMVDALENSQEQNGIKVDGYAEPGGNAPLAHSDIAFEGVEVSAHSRKPDVRAVSSTSNPICL
ncbi:MAG TPA: hypothetical protein VIF14_06630 [Alphaproteobacteria bacterium]|jgi:hypothetical protein